MVSLVGHFVLPTGMPLQPTIMLSAAKMTATTISGILQGLGNPVKTRCRSQHDPGRPGNYPENKTETTFTTFWKWIQGQTLFTTQEHRGIWHFGGEAIISHCDGYTKNLLLQALV